MNPAYIDANKRVAAALGQQDKELQAKYEAMVDDEIQRFKKAYEIVKQ